VSRLLRAGAAAAVALSLASCAGKAPDTPAATSSTAAGATSSSSAAGQTIQVSYAGGTITGGGRVPVKEGTSVTLEVTSDVADEVHVHGYDLMRDVTPDAPATITFDATIPGVFEVELEELGSPLLTLQVA
jgi:FtsP/CotA-like multicopper oxidase with cupredoxin domain